MLSPRTFGKLPGGEVVQAWTLRNAVGASLQVITYGGIVTHLHLPDGAGQPVDVVLGFDELGPYLARGPYFGAIAGRVAGRITGGKFSLGGREFVLVRNDPPNHLHGGSVGFDKKLWTAEPAERPDRADSVRLTLRSEAGDEGYPGEVHAAVTFTLTDRNEFFFETEVSVSEATPVSLTHHSYFNLGGHDSAPIVDHEFQVAADAYAPTDAAMTLLGRREEVAGLACDLRRSRRLSAVLPDLFARHGDLYFVHRDTPSALVPAARVVEPRSGRVMEVRTTEDCVQFYTGVSLDGSLRGKSGVTYGRHQGFCLECEGYPDAVNVPALGDIIVEPGRPRRQTTVYAFSTD